MEHNTQTAIVLVHGWTYQKDRLSLLEDLFKRAGYVILSPRLPGLAGAAEPSEVWGVYEYRDWLVTYIKNNHIKTPVFIIGHSFGGAVSALVAGSTDTLVQGLVLISPSGVRKLEFIGVMRNYFVRFFSHVFTLPVISSARFVAQKVWYKIIGTSDYQRASEHMRKVMAKVVRQDITENLSHVSVPTLLVWARNDTSTPLSMANVWRTQIPHAEFIDVPGASHTFLYDRPEIVFDALDEFIHRHELSKTV